MKLSAIYKNKLALWLFNGLKKGHPRLGMLIPIIVALSVAQYLTCLLVVTHIRQSLIEESKLFLLADIEIRSTKPLSPQQEAVLASEIPKGSKIQDRIECLSVATIPGTTRSTLIGLKGIDTQFPLYGTFKLKNTDPHTFSKKRKDLQHFPQAWIDPSLKITLNIKPNDLIAIGTQTFEVGGIIEEEPGFNLQNIALGPRVYIGKKWIQSSHLSEEGGQLIYIRSIGLHHAEKAEKIIQRIRHIWGLTAPKTIQTMFSNTVEDIQIIRSAEKAQQSIRILKEFTHYINLITLMVLVLSGIAISTLFNHYIETILPQLEIAKILGVKNEDRLLTLFHLLRILVSKGLGAGLILGIILYTLLTQLYGNLTQLGTQIGASILTIAITTLETAFIIGACATWPLIKKKTQAQYKWATITLLGVFIIFSIHLSIKWAGIAITCGISFVIFLYYFNVFALKILQKWALNQKFIWQYVIGNLLRFKKQTIWNMVCIGMGTFCVAITLLYQSTLIEMVNGDQKSGFPDLFLIGIYDRQQTDIQHFFYQWTAQVHFSPIIKARLKLKNGKTFNIEDMTEQQKELLEREQNLSYRDQLSESEFITKGNWMQGPYQSEASLDEWFAKKLNISLGDKLTFDIQGVQVTAKVTSLRHVRWMSFKPNFFILISPNNLQEAPKEWVASVSGLNQEAQYKIQAQLAEQFPNVTPLSVHQAMYKIQTLLRSIFWIILGLSSLIIISGLSSLSAIVHTNLEKRKEDLTLLKILGFPLLKLKEATYLEWACLTGIATSTALLSALIIGTLLIKIKSEMGVVYPLWQWTVLIIAPLLFSLRIAKGFLLKLTKNSSI